MLKYYTPIDSYYKLMKTVDDDPMFDKKRAQKKLRSFVESNEVTISKKAAMMVDHFHEQVIAKKKIGGQTRAMVVTASILSGETDPNKLYDLIAVEYERDPNINKTYGRAWKRIRDRYAAEHPLCEVCKENGRFVPAEEVHHKKPISQGGTHARDNLMSLCRSCHTKIHHEIGDR